MRFNNRACALMEIPDLPQGAFEHFGDGKIQPQGGGGGGIVDAGVIIILMVIIIIKAAKKTVPTVINHAYALHHHFSPLTPFPVTKHVILKRWYSTLGMHIRRTMKAMPNLFTSGMFIFFENISEMNKTSMARTIAIPDILE